MAISLAQVSRQRASTTPCNTRPYNSGLSVPTQIPEQYQHRRSACPSQQDYGPFCFPRQATTQHPVDTSYHISLPSTFQEAPTQDRPTAPRNHNMTIPLSSVLTRTANECSSSGSSSPHSLEQQSSIGSSSHYSASSIEPDPLPPHSNPQALTQTQSEAFFGSKPIPPLRVGRDEIYNSYTGVADFRIAREDGNILPSFMSTKPRISIIKTENGLSMAQIRFHTISSNKIDLAINGRETAIAHTGVLHNRWCFESTTCLNSSETWYWKKDRETGGAMLEDAKRHGTVLAKMKGDLLTFEKARLSQESYEEIVASAVALAEAARRQKRKSDIVDVAAAVGDFASSDGKGVAETGVRGSWG